MHLIKLDDMVDSGEQFYIAKEKLEAKQCIEQHSHDHYEIFWVREGSGSHMVNGKKVPLRQGALLFIRPADKHQISACSSESLELNAISFYQATTRYFHKRYYPHSRKYFWSKEKAPYVDILDIDLLNWLNTKFETLFHKPRTNFTLDQFLLSLFEMLGRSNPLLDEKDIPGWLFNALNQYKTPRHFVRGAEGFAALANRSVEHVSRTIKKHFNMTLSEVINKERMLYAARQLVITDDPIFSIAMDCNFSHISYFYSLFKEHYKITPGEYRELNRRFF